MMIYIPIDLFENKENAEKVFELFQSLESDIHHGDKYVEIRKVLNDLGEHKILKEFEAGKLGALQ